MVCARPVLVVLLCLCSLFDASLAEAKPSFRSAMVPFVGVGVGVHPKIMLIGEFQLRVALNDEARRSSDSQGFQVRGGPSFRLLPFLALDVHYAYSKGLLPVEGPGEEEHRGQLGLRIGTPRSEGKKFAVSNRTRVDLRGYRIAQIYQEAEDQGFSFHVRMRNETVVTAIVKEWFQSSLQAEALLQPDLGSIDMLQLRTALVLHGRISLGHRASEKRAARRRPPPALYWLAGSQLLLSPVSLLKAGSGENGSIGSIPGGSTLDNWARSTSFSSDPANHVDMLVSCGLSVVF